MDGKFLSYLVLALSQTLRTADADASPKNLSDVSLQAFAFMTRELGRLMSTLTLAWQQVWFTQLPLSEGYRTMVRTLPAV